MSMTQREKVLVGAVGAACSLFIGQSVWNSIQDGFDAKTQEIGTLQSTLDTQNLDITRGELSSKKIYKVLPRSLSKRDEYARADYMEWLIELSNSVGLSNPTPRSMGMTRDPRDGFAYHKFSLSAMGGLKEVTSLLKEFESKPFLHRINRFEINPSPDPKESGWNKLSMEFEVVALPNAKDRQQVPKSDVAFLSKPIEEYEAAIHGRNLYEPRNKPPQLEAKKSVDGIKGLPITYSLDAKETDANQTVFYELEGDVPEGLKLDKETGKISWVSNDIGKVSFTVVAKDNGLPMMSTKQELTIEVKDPPPPPPPPTLFDVASQAKLTALLSGESGPEAWVFSRTEGKTIQLREGDEMKLGDIKGKILKIGASYVEVETEGKRWTIGTDESVADAFKRGQVD